MMEKQLEDMDQVLYVQTYRKISEHRKIVFLFPNSFSFVFGVSLRKG